MKKLLAALLTLALCLTGLALAENAASDYVVRYVDQNGDPVPGVFCQVCDDSTCMLYTSDENGECRFTLAPYAWEIHTLRVPAGYEGDTETVTAASPEGGELEFVLTLLGASEEDEAEAAGEAAAAYELGDAIEDFTVTAIDGRVITLSEVLKEKDMVLLNLWATWCGPCEMEFPAMQTAYEQHRDRIEIVALSIEPDDTDEVLASYVSSHGMTFPVGHDTFDFMSKFDQEGIPTSVVIDRFGVICFIECGAMTEPELFELVFEPFLSEDYTASFLMTEEPRVRPAVEPADEALLAAALDVETALNPEDEYTWPMVPAEADGRRVLVPSNIGVRSESEAEVSVPVTAAPGDAVVITAQVSTYPGFDILSVKAGDERIKAFSGDMGWFTYAIPVAEAGEYTLTFNYYRGSGDDYTDSEDLVCVDSVAVLSGEEAAAALAANTVYPHADATAVLPVNAGARQVAVSDPDAVAEWFGPALFYVIHEETAEFEITIDDAIDPDADIVYVDYDGRILLLRDVLENGVYAVSTGMDSLSTTGYSYTVVYVYWDNFLDSAAVCVFPDEENANYFFGEMLGEYIPDLSWSYADGTAFATDAIPEVIIEVPDEAAFVVTYVDQNGDPVPGAVCQVCDDELCLVFTSDENGECRFELEPYPYEIHTLIVPEGYEGDTETVFTASPYGEEIEFTLTKLN